MTTSTKPANRTQLSGSPSQPLTLGQTSLHPGAHRPRPSITTVISIQDCNISNVLAMEILQSSTKPSIRPCHKSMSQGHCSFYLKAALPLVKLRFTPASDGKSDTGPWWVICPWEPQRGIVMTEGNHIIVG